MRLSFVSLASFVCLSALAGCTITVNEGANDAGTSPTGDSGPGDDTGPATDSGGAPTTITIKSVKAGGDFKMSGSLGLDTGKLKVTVAAIRDPDAPAKPADPAKVAFAVTAADKAMTCTVGKVSTDSKAAVDLVFVNDTTGSMSGTVLGIADSVQKFAEDVAAGGVDARFSMYTYGDAFATMPAEGGPTFSIAKSDFVAPAWDPDPRPYVGLSDLATFKGFLGELKTNADTVLGVGGGDGEENTLGALDYANKKVAWRDGAAHMFVAIGDNPSHQKGSSTEIVSPFEGPTGAELVTSLNGNAVVHVVGEDYGDAPFYNLKTLADQTGGAFITLPSDGVVDLGALNLKDWLTTSFAGTCNDPAGGSYTIVVQATITGTKAYVGTLTFDVELK